MIEINTLTIEYIDGTLSFDYTLDGVNHSYEGINTKDCWTIEELKLIIKTV